MDATSMIGATAAINVRQMLSSITDSLHEIKSQWKGADSTVTNLIAQLVALTAAVGTLPELMESESARAQTTDRDHKLVLDLDLSLFRCKMLIEQMGTQLSDLHRLKGGGLDNARKINVMLEIRSMSRFQLMAGRHTNALILLLTVYEWYVLKKLAISQYLILL